MKISKKTVMFFAAGLTAFGIIISFIGLLVVKFDFKKFGTQEFDEHTYELVESFDKISMDVGSIDVKFVLSKDGKCKIVCRDETTVNHYAQVEEGSLVIKTEDNRRWYHKIGLFFESAKMTVYLPQGAYTSLAVNSDAGDIMIPEEFTFANLQIDGNTLDVKCAASVSGAMEIKLSTGDIKLEKLSVGQIDIGTSTGDIKLNAVTVSGNTCISANTGDVNLKDISCVNLTVECGTGDTALKNIIANNLISIECDTGDVKFDGSDAWRIVVKTNTGDVKGTVLSDKVFICETSKGKVEVPESVTGGKCEVKTDTGDIKLSIKPPEPPAEEKESK